MLRQTHVHTPSNTHMHKYSHKHVPRVFICASAPSCLLSHPLFLTHWGAWRPALSQYKPSLLSFYLSLSLSLPVHLLASSPLSLPLPSHLVVTYVVKILVSRLQTVHIVLSLTFSTMGRFMGKQGQTRCVFVCFLVLVVGGWWCVYEGRHHTDTQKLWDKTPAITTHRKAYMFCIFCTYTVDWEGNRSENNKCTQKGMLPRAEGEISNSLKTEKGNQIQCVAWAEQNTLPAIQSSGGLNWCWLRLLPKSANDMCVCDLVCIPLWQLS